MTISFRAILTRLSHFVPRKFEPERTNDLEPQSNGQCNAVIGTLAVDGWAVTIDTARRGLDGLWLRPFPSSLYQM